MPAFVISSKEPFLFYNFRFSHFHLNVFADQQPSKAHPPPPPPPHHHHHVCREGLSVAYSGEIVPTETYIAPVKNLGRFSRAAHHLFRTLAPSERGQLSAGYTTRFSTSARQNTGTQGHSCNCDLHYQTTVVHTTISQKSPTFVWILDSQKGIELTPFVDYARKHGYDIFFDFEMENKRGAMWHKFVMVESAISTGLYDWVWWMDFDTLITNNTIKVEDVVEESLANLTNPDLIDFIFTSDW